MSYGQVTLRAAAAGALGRDDADQIHELLGLGPIETAIRSRALDVRALNIASQMVETIPAEFWVTGQLHLSGSLEDVEAINKNGITYRRLEFAANQVEHLWRLPGRLRRAWAQLLTPPAI